MAVVGGYTLDLYCDTGGEAFGEFCPRHGRNQFTGQNERECLKAARLAGWSIKRGDMTDKAFCPSCSRDKKGKR